MGGIINSITTGTGTFKGNLHNFILRSSVIYLYLSFIENDSKGSIC